MIATTQNPYRNQHIGFVVGTMILGLTWCGVAVAATPNVSASSAAASVATANPLTADQIQSIDAFLTNVDPSNAGLAQELMSSMTPSQAGSFLAITTQITALAPILCAPRGAASLPQLIDQLNQTNGNGAQILSMFQHILNLYTLMLRLTPALTPTEWHQLQQIVKTLWIAAAEPSFQGAGAMGGCTTASSAEMAQATDPQANVYTHLTVAQGQTLTTLLGKLDPQTAQKMRTTLEGILGFQGGLSPESALIDLLSQFTQTVNLYGSQGAQKVLTALTSIMVVGNATSGNLNAPLHQRMMDALSAAWLSYTVTNCSHLTPAPLMCP